MKKLFSIVIVLVSLLTSDPILAQNYLFREGESGFHIQGRYRNIMKASVLSYNAELAYTIKGRLTIGVDYDLWMTPGISSSSEHVGLDIDYLLFDQRVLPVSISLGGYYTFSSYLTAIEEFNELVLVTEYLHHVELYANLFRRFDLKSKISIIPSVSIGMMERFAYSSSEERFNKTVMGMLSIKNDVTFNFINIFAGVEFLFTHEMFLYYNFNVGLGFIIKT